MASALEILKHQQILSASFDKEPLLVHPNGQTIDLATGYIPLLSTYTTEDKAAKGLRKGKETSSEPDYFSLLELVRDNQILLLSGPTGSGKSTFAKHLCFSLVGQDHVGQDAAVGGDERTRTNKRELSGLRPCYFAIASPDDLEALARRTIPMLLADVPALEPTELIVVIDGVENTGPKAADHIESIAAQFLASSNKRHRLILLGDVGASSRLVVPLTVARYNIKPLSSAQRRQTISQVMHVEPDSIDYALGDAASNPALFALALQSKHQDDQPEALLDAWLDVVAGTGDSAVCIEQDTFQQMCQEVRHAPALELELQCIGDEPPSLAHLRKTKHLLAARHLSNLPADVAVGFYRHDPVGTADIIRSLLARLHDASLERFDALSHALLQNGDTTSHRAALLIARAGSMSAQLEQQIRHAALAILEESRLSIAERQNAASVLSRLGDPRDLTALVAIPAGTVTLGSNTHPNSQPMHRLYIGGFRIAVFPVTIQQYAAFAAATSRLWVSPDQQDPCKQNFPATDVTWHDAVAYCAWLTIRWRATGTIAGDERVCLPSEPEWERAACGGLSDLNLSERCVYPWGTDWHGDASNSEETGLNQPCAVGLLPEGRSPFGCHDMAGNVWEWCTTLWGEDMATPSFSYPWQDDGREAAEAAPEIRRVLRGGCFSSGRLKAHCTYRGSLEPGGYWRGNGFRIVVSKG
jgi:iron(II)-dependent oxidoreductase